MIDHLRNFPISTDSFENIRNEGRIYVDKTKHIAELRRRGSYVVVLCRPRRLGKTLFLTTLKAYFEGKKELFKGLYLEKAEEEMAAEEKREAWIKYPILHFNFCGVQASPNGLKEKLDQQLSRCESEYGCQQQCDDPCERLAVLVGHVHKQTGQRAVILVDEADLPLQETFDNPELNDRNNRTLCAFYSVTKSYELDIEMCFLTGLSQVKERNIFSGFNNWINISFNKTYHDICGLTEQEVKDNFAPELTALAKKQGCSEKALLADLERRYGGFNFGGEEGLYNPNSLMYVFRDLRYDSHWVDEYSLRFTIPALIEQKTFIPELEKFLSSEDTLLSSEPTWGNGIPRLFQTGFVSIKPEKSRKEKREMQMTRLCNLGFTNEEEMFPLLRCLAERYFPSTTDSDLYLRSLACYNALEEGKLDEALAVLTELLQRISYEQLPREGEYDWVKNPYYQTGLYLIFRRLSASRPVTVTCEAKSVDVTIQTPAHCYIFAFAFLKDVTPADALALLKEREYANASDGGAVALHLVGVSFNEKKRNIGEYTEEVVSAGTGEK